MQPNPAWKRALALLPTALLAAAALGGCSLTKAPDPAAEIAVRYQFQYQRSPWAIVDPTPGMKSYSSPAPAHKTQYAITAVLDPATSSLHGEQETTYTNDESAPLPDIYFHLFANAPYFQTDENAARRGRQGYMHIRSVTADGRPLVMEGDGQMLHITLPSPVQPGQAVKLHLRWDETIPTTQDRLGQMGSNYYLGNWYPTLAVHDAGGWHLDRYFKDLDPFFTVTADYDVQVTVPEKWVVGATGHRDPVIARTDGRQTQHFVATNVRDFAMALGPGFNYYERSTPQGVLVHYLEDTSGGTSRLSGGTPLQPRDVLDTLANCLDVFSRHFGAYPYADFTMVGREGMEYPQFVMSEPNATTIAHETAHQWWGEMLGNDENRQIWDEGLTTWSQWLPDLEKGKTVTYFMPPVSEHMTKDLYQYGHDAEWYKGILGSALYSRAAVFWELLHEQMGDEKFYGMLQQMFSDHKYDVLTWADWHQAVLKHGGPAMETYWQEYVESDARPTHYPAKAFIPGVTQMRAAAKQQKF